MLNPKLIKVWFRDMVGIELSLNPVTFPELGEAVQVNKVPAMEEVRVRFVEVLLQICSFNGTFDRFGTG